MDSDRHDRRGPESLRQSIGISLTWQIRIVGGRLTATGTGAVGIYCSGDSTIAHVDSITALTSISSVGGTTAAVFGNQFDPTTTAGAGTIEYRYGDRSAWDVDNYPARHASDIEGATFDYHNDPANPPLSAALTNTHIFVGNASNIATDVAMSGDATMANTGALTIANDAVTYAKMQIISTLIYGWEHSRLRF